jgi:transposase
VLPARSPQRAGEAEARRTDQYDASTGVSPAERQKAITKHARLAAQGIQPIAPHRAKRKKPKTQDGRPLRRYKRRWQVERLFAWLQNFRRVLVRYGYDAENYLGFVRLGCTIILLRWY